MMIYELAEVLLRCEQRAPVIIRSKKVKSDQDPSGMTVRELLDQLRFCDPIATTPLVNVVQFWRTYNCPNPKPFVILTDHVKEAA